MEDAACLCVAELPARSRGWCDGPGESRRNRSLSRTSSSNPSPATRAHPSRDSSARRSDAQYGRRIAPLRATVLTSRAERRADSNKPPTFGRGAQFVSVTRRDCAVLCVVSLLLVFAPPRPRLAVSAVTGPDQHTLKHSQFSSTSMTRNPRPTLRSESGVDAKADCGLQAYFNVVGPTDLAPGGDVKCYRRYQMMRSCLF
ncbi:hypothetical protein B0T16DRAFT_195690 [Cercophora newfieldiana]|uniref:Uncharacterized protein n=1 Tax=Cercophora newfieldiana TaxID=92897 RepID=A0AA39Y1M0_9PEZI|nr:hypothetical protein B0T16DRAFT_195690 [Cercophora newfieldiana]